MANSFWRFYFFQIKSLFILIKECHKFKVNVILNYSNFELSLNSVVIILKQTHIFMWMEFSFKKAIKNRIESIKAINLFHNNFKQLFHYLYPFILLKRERK
jgi:hypothetical protein